MALGSGVHYACPLSYPAIPVIKRAFGIHRRALRVDKTSVPVTILALLSAALGTVLRGDQLRGSRTSDPGATAKRGGEGVEQDACGPRRWKQMQEADHQT